MNQQLILDADISNALWAAEHAEQHKGELTEPQKRLDAQLLQLSDAGPIASSFSQNSASITAEDGIQCLVKVSGPLHPLAADSRQLRCALEVALHAPRHRSMQGWTLSILINQSQVIYSFPVQEHGSIVTCEAPFNKGGACQVVVVVLSFKAGIALLRTIPLDMLSFLRKREDRRKKTWPVSLSFTVGWSKALFGLHPSLNECLEDVIHMNSQHAGGVGGQNQRCVCDAVSKTQNNSTNATATYTFCGDGDGSNGMEVSIEPYSAVSRLRQLGAPCTLSRVTLSAATQQGVFMGHCGLVTRLRQASAMHRNSKKKKKNVYELPDGSLLVPPDSVFMASAGSGAMDTPTLQRIHSQLQGIALDISQLQQQEHGGGSRDMILDMALRLRRAASQLPIVLC